MHLGLVNRGMNGTLVVQLHHSHSGLFIDSLEATQLRLRSLFNRFEYVLIDFHLMWFQAHLATKVSGKNENRFEEISVRSY